MKNSNASWHDNYIRFVLKHRLLTLTLCVLLIVGFMSFLPNLKLSISYKDMLNPQQPQLMAYETIQQEYTRDDNILLLIDAGDQAFSPQTLSAIADISRELWKTPYSVRVDSVTNFQITQAQGDNLTISSLLKQGVTPTQNETMRIKELAMAEPLLLKRLLSEDGRVLGINISLTFPNKAMHEKPDAVTYVKKVVEEFEQQLPYLTVYIAGLATMDVAIADLASQETAIFFMALLITILVLMGYFFRSLTLVFSSLLIFIVSIISCMAVAGMFDWKLTPITMSVPLVLLIIAVADCVHYLTTFRQHYCLNHDKDLALIESFRVNLQPLAVTSLTTAVGFLTMNFSQSQSMNALGTQVAIGTICAFLFSISLLPCLISLLPVKPPAKVAKNRDFSFVAQWLKRNNRTVLSVSAIFTSIMIGFASLNVFNDEVPKYLHESTDFRQASDFADQTLGGSYNYAVSIDSGKSNGISDPDFLNGVDEFVDWLRTQPDVIHVVSITDTLKRLNKNMHGDEDAWYGLPEDKKTASQYLLLYEMSLPYGLDLNDQINLDKSATRILINFRVLTMQELIAMEKRLNQWLQTNLPDYKITASGVQIMFAHLMHDDSRSMVIGTMAALLIISILFIAVFRSVRIGLISIAPNIMPAMIAFGIWGIVVGEIGLGLAMVLGMTLGIVVDDTVHFLNKYLRARREKNLSAVDAISYVYSSVGSSIFITSLVLIAGFLVMSMSRYKVNSDMGTMTSMIVFIALVFDFFFLPALLICFDKSPQTEKSSSSQPHDNTANDTQEGLKLETQS